MQSGQHIYRTRHGGYCCGMSGIAGIGFHWAPIAPQHILAPRVALSSKEWARNIRESPNSISRINETYPQQTAEERLKEAIKRTVKGVPSEAYPDMLLGARPRGIIEVVLTTRQAEFGNPDWRTVLTELNFKEVNSSVNSNTGNIVHVFHLNTGE